MEFLCDGSQLQCVHAIALIEVPVAASEVAHAQKARLMTLREWTFFTEFRLTIIRGESDALVNRTDSAPPQIQWPLAELAADEVHIRRHI